MYLVVIAWIYVVLMMSVAEATNSTGTVLGALVTFVLYGAGPAALVVYLMGTPARNRALKKREAEERARSMAAHLATSGAGTPEGSQPSQAPLQAPDGGGHAAGGPGTAGSVSPVGKES